MVKVNVSRTKFSLSIAISIALTPNLRKLNFSQISPRMSESFEYVGHVSAAFAIDRNGSTILFPKENALIIQSDQINSKQSLFQDVIPLVY